MHENVTAALLLTALAGLATGLGSLAAIFVGKTGRKFLAASLGFSAGVMLYISFAEMYMKSRDYLINSFGETRGLWLSCAAFFGGMALIMLIDNMIPSPESKLTAVKTGRRDDRLARMGTLTALAIAIHNFPEGLATFTSALDDVSLGAAIAVAIAIHNIPEGIVTSVPIYCATGSRSRAFAVSFLSGLTEPMGAAAGYLLLRPFLGDTLYGIIFAMISGIMVYIAVEELIPMAREYDKGNTMILGAAAGMAVMAVSLMLF